MSDIVKKFIRRASFETDHLFVVLTYGTHHGGVAEIANLFFRNAGKKIDYITTMEMVDNFLPVFDMKKQTAMDKQAEKYLDEIRTALQERRQGIQKAEPAKKTVHKKKECYVCVHAWPKIAVEFTLFRPEKNPGARYYNEHVTFCELVRSNDQTENDTEYMEMKDKA